MTTPTDSTRPSGDGLLRRTIKRRWVPILALGLILSLSLIAAVQELVRPTYQALSLIRVDPTAGVLEPDTKQDFTPFLETQVQMITSPNVLSVAANNPKVAVLPWINGSADPIFELRKVLHVSIRPKTYVIEVSATSESATEAASVVNAAVEAYVASAIEWSTGMTRNQITALEKYLADLTNTVSDLDRKWMKLAARQGVEREAARPGLMNADHARQVQARWAENDLKRMEIQARLEALRLRKDADAQRMIVDLETDLDAANILDRTLKARLTPSGDEARAQATTEVDIALVKEERESLNVMRDAVRRRLEKLKFESSNGDGAVRPLNNAQPPGKPVSDLRPTFIAIIPFASFALMFTLFAGIESLSLGRGLKVPMPPEA